jgi:hypothetical protein
LVFNSFKKKTKSVQPTFRCLIDNGDFQREQVPSLELECCQKLTDSLGYVSCSVVRTLH